MQLGQACGSTQCGYVFQLPPAVVWDLSAMLDVGDIWEDVAARMIDISDADINACRRLRSGERPTEALLRIWGGLGYKTVDLFKVFYGLKFVRCMQILRPYVDKEYQARIDDVISVDRLSARQSDQNRARGLPSCPSPNSPSSTNTNPTSNQASASAGGRSPEISKHNLPNPSSSTSLISSKKKTNSGSDAFSSAATSDAASNDSSFIAGLQNTVSVKYEDILGATDNFAPDRILGRGGYGVVYRGVWEHTEVAIKRIQGRNQNSVEQQKERIRQSLQELRTLAKFRHDNVLSLYGYSMDGAEPCLIYQFMSNGTLEDRLLCRNATEPFSWALKLSICKGVSCGLHFLHSISTFPIIHGDVKSANILLDKHMEPKLGDFGLSRDGQKEMDGSEKSPMIASHIKGTLAYLPPEFTTSKIITTKLDVYSFGVVLLEAATGQRAYSNTREPSNLVEYARKHIPSIPESQEELERIMDKLADKRTPDTYMDENHAIFKKLVTLGLGCTHKERAARPVFSEAFKILSAP